MTVSDLRKALKGVKGTLDVYTRDHDHNEYEVNGLTNSAGVIDQKNMDEHERMRQKKGRGNGYKREILCCFSIKEYTFVTSIMDETQSELVESGYVRPKFQERLKFVLSHHNIKEA